MVSLSPAELTTIIVASVASGFLTRYCIALWKLWKNREEDQQLKNEDKIVRWDG